MDYQSLQDLYIHELKDLYSAEKQIIRALPKMIRHVTNPKLRDGLERHLEETKTHLERLETIFNRMGRSTRGAKCRGIEGIIEEAAHWLECEASPEVMDAGIIACAQKVEHYEMAGYGTVRTFAGLLGCREDESLLDKTLQEEGKADKALTAASDKINPKAQMEAKTAGAAR